MWELATGEGYTLAGHRMGLVFHVVFCPDGKHLASLAQPGDPEEPANEEYEVITWNLETRRLEKVLDNKLPFTSRIAYSPTGDRLAVSTLNGIKVWGTDSGREAWSSKGTDSFGAAICFSPNGKWLATSSGRFEIQIRDATTGKVEKTLMGPQGLPASTLAFRSGQ